jgi:hypothetical protein
VPSINSLRISLSVIQKSFSDQLLAGAPLLSNLRARCTEIEERHTNRQKPTKGLARREAFNYLSGIPLSAFDSPGIIAFALNETFDEFRGASISQSTGELTKYLEFMTPLFERGNVIDIYWFGILQAYFQMVPSKDDRLGDKSRRDLIRNFLARSWINIFDRANHKPRWMREFSSNLHLLEEYPSRVYASEWLEGNDTRLKKLRVDIAIQDNSWFWDDFFISTLQAALKESDSDFKPRLPAILSLLGRHPTHLDWGLRAVLDRYCMCVDRRKNDDLLDFAIERWGVPRLRSAPGNKWSKASEESWRLVNSWLNEGNLRLFFELLRKRGAEDPHGRLDFWLGYINQIVSTRLVLGFSSQRFLRSVPDMQRELSNDGYSLAKLRSLNNDDDETDAFIMEIDRYVIVEFNPRGGCYIYRRDQHSFDLTADSFSAGTGTGGLKEGYYEGTRGPDLVHSSNWQQRARNSILLKRGIFSDQRAGAVRTAARDPMSFRLADYF